MSLAQALEFAPGTTEDCQKMVVGLFKPEELLGAYRAARKQFNSGDIVMITSAKDPSGFAAEPRVSYLKRLRQVLGDHAKKSMSVLGMAEKSAHSVVKLPFESDAFWLVVTRGTADLPLMVVLFTTPYEKVSAGATLIGEA